MAGKKDAAKATMTIQIVKVGVRKEGLDLVLRGEGKLYDIDGHPVKTDGLKKTFARPDLLNESNELVINLYVGNKKAALLQSVWVN
jgi:hypothetical protein